MPKNKKLSSLDKPSTSRQHSYYSDCSSEDSSDTEYSYSCRKCSYTTLDKHLYDSHVGRHKLKRIGLRAASESCQTKDKYFRCKKCDFSGPRRKDIIQHDMLLHHKKKSDTDKIIEEKSSAANMSIDTSSPCITQPTNEAATSEDTLFCNEEMPATNNTEDYNSNKDNNKVLNEVPGPNAEQTKSKTKYNETPVPTVRLTRNKSNTNITVKSTPIKNQVKESTKNNYDKKSDKKRSKKNLQKQTYACNECEYKTRSKYLMGRHEKTHEMFTCKECGLLCAGRMTLIKHVKIVHFSCDVCGLQYTNKVEFLKHKDIHVPKPQYMCVFCIQYYWTKDSLEEHVKTHNQAHEEIYKCRVCKKKYFNKFLLQQHRRTHFGKIIYCCNFCGDKFLTEYGVKKHTRNYHKNTFYSYTALRNYEN